jgi:hypothetical protein
MPEALYARWEKAINDKIAALPAPRQRAAAGARR